MTLSISPTTATADDALCCPWDTLAPLRFPSNLRLTPKQFALVCAENREALLELTADDYLSDDYLIVMTPTGSETGARIARLGMRLTAMG